MVRKGLTDPNVSADFRISSLYGLPWWSSESAADRAKLADDVLRASKGYETGVAVEALRDIQDPSSIKYLSSFLAGNTDNAAARTGAINALALKNTPEAWNAIELAAQNDTDENVRKNAQRQLATRESSVEGVMITWVGADSQGALAGIKVGDVLTSYNGVRIKTLEDVNKAKEAVGADQTVTVIVRRGSEDVNLQLGPGMIGINGTAVSPKK
jgi:membrane-associated protease RseP (regulator of RpoE activity)